MKSLKNMNQEQFWKVRSRRYNNFKWVNEPSYTKAFISSTDFNKNDVILDVGTGTGVVAHALAPLVKQVIGLDISQDMRARAHEMHVTGSDVFKKAYNMKIVNGDCLIDVRFLILVGEKAK